jgi:hypothetical protein
MCEEQQHTGGRTLDMDEGRWRWAAAVTADGLAAKFASLAAPPPESCVASLRLGVFHEVGGCVSIRRGMDGNGGVWAGVGSASDLTERGVIDGPGLNLARADPREFTGIGLSSPPGRG